MAGDIKDDDKKWNCYDVTEGKAKKDQTAAAVESREIKAFHRRQKVVAPGLENTVHVNGSLLAE